MSRVKSIISATAEEQSNELLALAQDIQRRRLTRTELRGAAHMLATSHSWSATRIARWLGVDDGTVSRWLRTTFANEKVAETETAPTLRSWGRDGKSRPRKYRPRRVQGNFLGCESSLQEPAGAPAAGPRLRFVPDREVG